MAIDTYLFPNLGDGSVRRNQISAALDPHAFLAIHVLFTPSSIGFRKAMIWIGKQRKIQLKFVSKFGMSLFIIGTHTEHDRTEFLKLIARISECARFFGATGSIILGVKIKDNGFALELAEAQFLSRVRRKVNAGALVPTSSQSLMGCFLRILC